MEEKLTIKEQLARNKVLNVEKIKTRKENAEKKKLHIARQFRQEKKYRIATRDAVFDNCCKLVKECEGLDVLLEFNKPKYLQKFNLEGKIKYSQSRLTDGIRRNEDLSRDVSLKIGRITVVIISVSIDKNHAMCGAVQISLQTYSPRNYVIKETLKKDATHSTYRERFTIYFNPEEKKDTTWLEKIDSNLRKRVIKFFSKIVVDEETKKKRLEEKEKLSKKVEEQKALVESKELKPNEFDFIDLNDEDRSNGKKTYN